ncbi:MAG TPA: acylase [Puia sp.]|nr:acylase [Puia sp.]
MRKLFIFLLSLLHLSGHAGPPGGEIVWDRYGVPHIYGETAMGMYYAFGWAQMHNHANLILKLYGQARGKAAEYWGENYLPSDKQVLLFGLPDLAAREYAQQDPVFKGMLDAFVAGLNAYARVHRDQIDSASARVLPVTVQDVFAHGLRVVFLRFVAGEDLGMASRKLQAGSNALAIAPSRSAQKTALLLANPHLPWGDLFTWFEAHLQSPGFNAYGAAVVGLPVLNIAFNDHLGWTHTVNTIDVCDRYELSVRGDGYLLDGVVRPFEKRAVVLKSRQPDGRLKEQTVELVHSRHGPVIGIKGDKAYAIRIAGLENPRIFYQWHLMAAATDWSQFERALKMMQLPMFNVIYADGVGNIFYLFDGNVPDRAEGDWQFWHGTVDGTNSRDIWNKTLPYADLPKLLNPRTGFIQNANDPPWTCTYPPVLAPDRYPAYLSPRGMGLRPQRAVNMIRGDSLITLPALAAYKLNTGMEAADRFLTDLLAAAGEYGTDTLVKKAVAVLRGWDRATHADSRGAVLFARWFDKLSPEMFSRQWAPDDPVETPVGLKDRKGAVGLLAQAAGEVIRDYDSLDVAWGDVYRFRVGGLDYPANGGPEQYGIYRTIYFTRDKDNKYRAVAGDSYVAVTEFGKKVKAWVLLSYGNASQPGSRHLGDQLSLLARGELRPALLGKEEIEKNAEETERLK